MAWAALRMPHGQLRASTGWSTCWLSGIYADVSRHRRLQTLSYLHIKPSRGVRRLGRAMTLESSRVATPGTFPVVYSLCYSFTQGATVARMTGYRLVKVSINQHPWWAADRIALPLMQFLAFVWHGGGSCFIHICSLIDNDNLRIILQGYSPSILGIVWFAEAPNSACTINLHEGVRVRRASIFLLSILTGSTTVFL